MNQNTGSYSIPSGVKLKCTVHACPSKCHQLVDHSKMTCEAVMYFNCPKGHRRPFKCNDGPPGVCTKCEDDAKQAEKRQKAELAAQQKREKEQRLHDQKMAEIEAQLAQQQQASRDAQLAKERKRALEQRQKDLEAAISAASVPSQPVSYPTTSTIVSDDGRKDQTGPSTLSANPTASPQEQTTRSTFNPPPQAKPPARPVRPTPSPAETEWKRQKEVESAKNDAIDDIMQMGGLEEVKQQVLDIKSKVEITNRQGGSLTDVRFSASMLGNPGTGD